jgi:hypothetical protein
VISELKFTSDVTKILSAAEFEIAFFSSMNGLEYAVGDGVGPFRRFDCLTSVAPCCMFVLGFVIAAKKAERRFPSTFSLW